MEIRRLDLRRHDETDAWYRALREAASAHRVAPVVVEREALLTSLRSNDGNPNCDRRAYGAWCGTRCVGAALLVLPRHDNTHLAEIGIDVPPHARRRGVGRAMFDRLRDAARQEGRTVLATEVDAAGIGPHTLTAAPGGRFALACGFSPKHTELRRVLDVPVPEERLRALEETAAKRATEYHVVGWTGLPPLDVLGPFAHLHTLMDADVPTGELSREPVVYDAERVLRGQERLVEQGYGLVTTLIRDQDDSPVGYTTMCVMGGDNQEVPQDNTFVLRSRRGRGLGMLSKLSTCVCSTSITRTSAMYTRGRPRTTTTCAPSTSVSASVLWRPCTSSNAPWTGARDGESAEACSGVSYVTCRGRVSRDPVRGRRSPVNAGR
ncbi:GNAT family N-acetyltransferase [Streptomyces halstedii]|uniref:GNAT family N-acetyltransferase n=1 Tax=Streptomyces halstedii TaxID=1944 RepID=UPI003865593E|nr:GNAT family N-acetyltransferase [Streptomyces halstedii]